MRDLGKFEKNSVEIYDGRSGTNIVFFYRNPTPSEEVAYQSKLYQRKDNKLLLNISVRIDMGLEIIMGIRDGDFGIDGEPISSDPDSEIYYENWKEILRENASDLIMIFAEQIFERSRIRNDNILQNLEIEVADLPPFGKNSKTG